MPIAPVLLALALLTPTQPSSAPATKTDPPAATSPGPYRVLKTFAVGGEGGWGRLSLDPEAHRLYVARTTYVMVLDSDTGANVGEVPNTPGIHAVLAVPSLGKGFTTNWTADTCTIFDLKTLKTIKTLPTGKNPDAICFEPLTKRIFITNGGSKNVTAIDAESATLAATIDAGALPATCVADDDGHVFVNVTEIDQVIRIDARTMKIEARFPSAPGGEPTGLAIDPATHRLFLVSISAKLAVLDSRDGKLLGSAPIAKRTDAVAFDPAGFIICPDGQGSLVIHSADAAHGFGVVQSLKTPLYARTMAFDLKSRHIYMPAAEYKPLPPASPGAPDLKPNSFKIILFGPAEPPSRHPPYE